jgi:hypothetical protein
VIAEPGVEVVSESGVVVMRALLADEDINVVE